MNFTNIILANKMYRFHVEARFFTRAKFNWISGNEEFEFTLHMSKLPSKQPKRREENI